MHNVEKLKRICRIRNALLILAAVLAVAAIAVGVILLSQTPDSPPSPTEGEGTSDTATEEGASESSEVTGVGSEVGIIETASDPSESEESEATDTRTGEKTPEASTATKPAATDASDTTEPSVETVPPTETPTEAPPSSTEKSGHPDGTNLLLSDVLAGLKCVNRTGETQMFQTLAAYADGLEEDWETAFDAELEAWYKGLKPSERSEVRKGWQCLCAQWDTYCRSNNPGKSMVGLWDCLQDFFTLHS